MYTDDRLEDPVAVIASAITTPGLHIFVRNPVVNLLFLLRKQKTFNWKLTTFSLHNDFNMLTYYRSIVLKTVSIVQMSNINHGNQLAYRDNIKSIDTIVDII